MIKANNNVHISLDNIYNEIINISASVGECKSSIEHLEGNMIRLYQIIDIKIERINDQIEILTEDKIKREQRSNIVWSIFQFSPGIFIKIISFIILVVLLSFLPYSEVFRTSLANFIK